MSQTLSGCAVRAAIQQETYDTTRHYLVAIKTRLQQLYDEHPDDAKLREQLSDEVDWLDEQLQ